MPGRRQPDLAKLTVTAARAPRVRDLVHCRSDSSARGVTARLLVITADGVEYLEKYYQDAQQKRLNAKQD